MSTGYEDDQIVCDDTGVVIKRYYFPWGAKRIPYADINDVESLSLTGLNRVRRWRIWGSGDFQHWWNFDPRRPSKTAALVLDLGKAVRPTVTPDDPERAFQVIHEHLASSTQR
jgi:hypothetical protein